MLNQVSVEAVYSATYVENYLDCVENLPDELQRLISRMRELDVYYLDFGKEEQTQAENKEQQPPVNNTPTNNNTTLVNNERPTKRARRTRHDTFSGLENNHTEPAPAEHVLRSKKKKRKARQTAQAQKEESPPREEEPAIDPDEPTYCLCDQISYGEMIMCDNDLCPIEWFHFSCVTLTTKPKGKWYCPKCRGDRPNVMKPKAQFLRELEKYNKEKEEKT
ncbi:hypothetical protein NQ314_021224 [Rhamnusium bicolor]|uniref:Inhibitor of growth protein n=1 Tax=Rhamnusium bicolor TaxID=1586634 RepID=A0AAV8WJQ3_9CUCU|nr:hypothetical protein NQ314_021224 [Rhamnusium bicolor]